MANKGSFQTQHRPIDRLAHFRNIFQYHTLCIGVPKFGIAFVYLPPDIKPKFNTGSYLIYKNCLWHTLLVSLLNPFSKIPSSNRFSESLIESPLRVPSSNRFSESNIESLLRVQYRIASPILYRIASPRPLSNCFSES